MIIRVNGKGYDLSMQDKGLLDKGQKINPF